MAGAARRARGAHRGGGRGAVGPGRRGRAASPPTARPRPALTSTTRARERWLRLPDLPEGRAPRDGRLARGPPLRGRRLPASASAPGRPATAPGCSSTAAGGRCRGCPSRAPRVARRSCATGSTWSAGRPRGAGEPGARLAATSTCARCAGRASRGLSRPREHLGVTALGGPGLRRSAAAPRGSRPTPPPRTPTTRVARRWSRLPDAPTRRGGNGATAAGRLVVAVGGEGPDGTIRAGRRLRPGERAAGAACRAARGPGTGWRSWASGARVYQALGGPEARASRSARRCCR